MSTVLVPDVNEDSVDIYDDLDVGFHNKAGKSLFSNTVVSLLQYNSADIQHRIICTLLRLTDYQCYFLSYFGLLQRSLPQMRLSWKSPWIFMKNLSQRNSRAKRHHTLRWVTLCPIIPSSLLTCIWKQCTFHTEGEALDKPVIVSLFFSGGLCCAFSHPGCFAGCTMRSCDRCLVNGWLWVAWRFKSNNSIVHVLGFTQELAQQMWQVTQTDTFHIVN